MKEAAAVGAVVATGTVAVPGKPAAQYGAATDIEERCPYFDQPLYCRDMCEPGKRLCEK